MQCIDGGLKSGRFEFQTWSLYRNALAFAKAASLLCGRLPKDGSKSAVEQLRRTSQAIPVHIAQGCSRFRSDDRRESWESAREAVFACAAIVDLLRNLNLIGDCVFTSLLKDLSEMEKMLGGEETQDRDKPGQLQGVIRPISRNLRERSAGHSLGSCRGD